jgi:hypothetical protein
MLLIETIRNGELPISYGRTYVDEALTWIPRAIYPSRPRPLSEQFMETFYPVADAEGRGEGFYVLTAGYWAFGYFGVWLEMFLYGAIVALVYRWFMARRANDAVVLLYGPALFILAVAGTRTGLIGTLKGLMMFVVPFAILAGGVSFAARVQRDSRAESVPTAAPVGGRYRGR